MAILTGGAKDAIIEDDIFDQVLIIPDLTKVDEQIFLRDVISSTDPKTALGFLLIMLDYKKTEISYILGVSANRLYNDLVPNMKKAYNKAKKNVVCQPDDPQ